MAASQRLAERLAYRPREVVVVALLAAGLFGGLAIERGRARYPAIAERLETEPARPTAAPPLLAPPRSRPRAVASRCDAPDTRPGRDPWPVTVGPAPRFDLNRATPAELARVAGISWRLAARIVAARDAFEGHEVPASPSDEPAAEVPAEAAPEPAPSPPDSRPADAEPS